MMLCKTNNRSKGHKKDGSDKTHMQTDVVEKIQNYFKNQPIQRAWLFGSF